MQSAIPFEKRSVKHGKPTNDLVLSSYTDGNDRVFPRILKLYVSPGSEIADVTYGKGVFWRHVPDGLYKLHATDILCGVDCRNFPYGDGTIDCVVFDPPYMHTPGGTAHRTHKAFESHYRNNETHSDTGAKYHDAVVELYRSGGLEAYRVLRDRGVLIVKCQDEVCANRQRFTHVEIMLAYIEGRHFEVKTASLGANGTFQFNHVRLDRQYEYLLCLGICPNAIVFNMWRKGEVAEGKAGSLVRMAEGQAVTYKLTKRLDARGQSVFDAGETLMLALLDVAQRFIDLRLDGFKRSNTGFHRGLATIK